MVARVKIAEFGIIQKMLARAVVTFYTTNDDGSSTGIKATLFQASTGTASRANPQTLDENGKLSADCYVESNIVAAITGISDKTQRLIKKIKQNPLEFQLPVTGASFNYLSAAALYGDLAAVEAAATNASASAAAAAVSETNAETAETNAASSASTATTQAGISTTQAGIATSAASTATTQAGIATAVLSDAGFVAVSNDLLGANTIGTVASDSANIIAVATDLLGPNTIGAALSSASAAALSAADAEESMIAAAASLAIFRTTLLNIKDAVRLGKTQAAIGDGTLHTADEYYASLGALQADYPNATSLLHSMDQIVVDYIADSELDAFVPHGTYMFNFATPTRTNKSFILVGEKGTIFKGAGSGIDGRMFTFSGGVIRIDNIKFDMDNKFREVLVLSSVDYTENDCEYVNGGLGATAVTDYTTYVHMAGNDITFRIRNQKCRDITATGNNAAAGGSSLGAARYLLIEPSVNATVDGEIHNCNWKAGTSQAREFDIVNQNVNVLIGGTVFYGGIFEHSEYVRRDVKLHSGLFRFFGTRFVQSPDFTPAPPYGGVGVQGEAGINNIEIIGQAGSAAYPSRLELYNCFIDYRASGTGGFINSGNSTESSIYSFGCKYLGPTTTINRINPENGTAQTGSAIGFRGGLASLGCGVENSTFIDGLIPIQINGKNQFARNNIIDDPVTYAIYLNDTVTTGTAQAGGTTTTIVLSSGASNVTDFYKGRKVLITSGTNSGYYGDIVAYNGSTKTAIVSPAATSSFDATSVYSLCGKGIDISGNRVIHRTAGRLTGTEVIRLQGGLATSVNCQNNEFIRQSNVGSFLNYDAQTANFTQGKTITGATSGATATILYDKDSGTTGTLVLGSIVGTFIDNEIITDDNGTPGSATTNGVVTTSVSTIARFINPVTDFYGTVTNNRCENPETICVNLSNTNTKASIYNNNSTKHVRADTSTAYTINQSDCYNHRTLSNASAIACTLLSTAPAGFECTIEQLGAGQVTFSGATIQNRSGHTKTAGQYAIVNLRVRTNTTGGNAVWVLSGDTAA